MSSQSEVGERIAQWLEDERRIRATLAPIGVSPMTEFAKGSGLEFLQRLGRGELPSPPIGQVLGMVPIEVEFGRIVFQGIPKPEHYNPIGTVHGGYIATLLDSAVGCAVHTTLAQGFGYTTLELNVNYVRALSDQVGPVRAEGKVINVSRQVGIAEGRLTDAAGKLYAYATTTCLIFPLPERPPG
jgi:uncharacterized protein (TIGR00369 family)